MTWIADQIGADVPIYITENGFSDLIGNLDDLHREYYYKHYINQLLKGLSMRQVPLERDINGLSLVRNLHQERSKYGNVVIML